jgi:hypothetical protein
MSAARALALSAAAAAAGCGALTAQDRPALIARPTAASRAELLRVVAAAFGGRAVTLADDALTAGSVLIVEGREPRDAEGRRVSGRSQESPQRFRLVLRGSTCELVRESDGRRWPLTQTECMPGAPR